MTDVDDAEMLLISQAPGDTPAAIPKHGQSESYWTARNTLVDEVHARDPSGQLPSTRVSVGYAERTPEEQAVWESYGLALDALKAFDKEHGGSPVL